MILSIRNSLLGRAFSFLMIFVFIITLNPSGTFALTGGPAQPEFNSFTPIGTSDMVDLASGDFSYNIPLMDVGGFPINLAYNSGVTMDQEASWVGLGWDLSIGQINRQMRGLPDDFDGDKMTYENNVKDNYTVGGTFQFSPEAMGIKVFTVPEGEEGAGDTLGVNELNIKGSLTAQYNSYTGMSITPSLGLSFDMAKMGSVGFDASATPDGLVLSPSVSLNPRIKNGKKRDKSLGGTFGVSFNSRQGLTSVNMSTSYAPKKVFGKKLRARTNGKFDMSSIGSSKSFVPNTYTPSIATNMSTASGTFNAAFGTEFFGAEGEAEVTGFFSNQYLRATKEEIKAYGYEHTHRAEEDAILDFNREKDGVFTVNSTNLPITNYTYDLYSIQGQGVSGMFQPFRSQVGYVFDNAVHNNVADGALGIEIGGGQLFHVGADLEGSYTKSRTGVWEEDNTSKNSFTPSESDAINYEEIYFKNVGDLAVDENLDNFGTDAAVNLGNYQPIALKIGGGAYARVLQNTYRVKYKTDWSIEPSKLKRNKRVKRNQNVLKITAEQAQKTGADDERLLTEFLPNPHAKSHHTAGFIVTRNDGARYNYGKALYNTKKREVTFALGSGIGGGFADKEEGDIRTGLIHYKHGVDNSVDNKHGDHYYNAIQTPEYGHTFLLTSLLSADYSDVDSVKGPSAGDLGSYTKFQYRDIESTYKWRVPYQKDSANWNEGLKTDPTDDKGSYVYGEKQLSYIQKIETKTHVALFFISERHDAFGVDDESGSPLNTTTGSKMYKLDKVELYSLGEYVEGALDANGNITSSSTPIKTVHFEYDYSQCPGVPNNNLLPYDRNGDGTADDVNEGGKLTLKKVYFTYRDSKMGKYSPYQFSYGNDDPNKNPRYNLKGYDIWGGYKKNDGTAEGKTLDPLSAPEFNYVEQNNSSDEGRFDDYAAAWTITNIKLPSGGEIQIDYETDDYQYVQDKKAMRMFKLAGTGNYADPNDIPASDNDFEFNPTNALADQTNKEGLLFRGSKDAEYLYFELDNEDQSLVPGTDDELFRQKYLGNISAHQEGLVQFRVLMNMTKKGGRVITDNWKDEPFDYVSGYFELDQSNSSIFSYAGKVYGSVKMELVRKEGGLGGSSDVNPIAKAGWQYGRKYLSKFILGGEDIDGDGGTSVKQIFKKLTQSFKGLLETFRGANGLVKGMNIGKRIVPEKSWIRLMEPSTHKKGGGSRVKRIAMTDEWAAMTGTAEGGIMDQKYGQEYSYELKDGGSSGVATYEPVGSKENPLVQPVFVNVNRLLAPNEENYMEKPFGESFFPSPSVTYSRVTVKNLERVNEDGTRLTKHATGEVVTEFYTSKDFPTLTDQTTLEIQEDHNPLISNLLKVNVVKHLTLSQGYVVHLNDMNGKMKSQRVYAEGQSDFISGVDYTYDMNPAVETEVLFLPDGTPFNTYKLNGGKLNNTVLSLNPKGELSLKKIGVEHQIINDFREMRSVTHVSGVNGNTAGYTVGPIPIVIPVPLPDYTRHVDQLRIATTTKIINTYGILKETVAYDAGASVATRNTVWDSETGEVLVTETVNEYGDKYYSFNYPAHWAYKGMGQASFNTGVTANITASGSGYSIAGGGAVADYLYPGDEVVLVNNEGVASIAWVDQLYSTAVFGLIDAGGTAISIPSGQLTILRSGKRNIQSTSMGSVVLMKNPVSIIQSNGGAIPEDFLNTADWDEYKIVNSGAVEFKDEWALQCECVINPVRNTYNPYRFNTKGVWRADKSYLYLTGRHHNPTSADPRNDGFFTTYQSYYNVSEVDGVKKWRKLNEAALGKWTFTSQVSQFSPYGFELENEDALGRKSAAQYGYNFSFPLAVGANTGYAEMGYDGFEDYYFEGCTEKEHFGFRDNEPGDPANLEDAGVTNVKSHTGRFSLKINGGNSVTRTFLFKCNK